jgi:FAD/FMN-containing dehydrogenase
MGSGERDAEGGMQAWSNWSGRLEAQPAEIVRPSDEAGVRDAVRRAASAGRTVRSAGATHSHAALVPTAGTIIDMTGLAGVVSVDRAGRTARVRAGTRIADLGAPLRAAGLALHNQGDIDRQAIAGAVATGTHGTGRTLRNLSASVLAARLVLADGDVVECSAEREPELLSAARLSLGALGVATELTLSLRDAYRLEEKMWLEDLDSVLERIDALTRATRHFEFFYMPTGQRAACKALAETEAEPVYPLAGEGRRLAWSDEVLANERPDKHSEMEYSVPEASGPDCLREVVALIKAEFPDLAWPIEYRSLAADDVWLSTAYARATTTISVHQGVDHDDAPLFRACEPIFRRHGGRPHWGKVHFLDADSLAAIHPRWADWWRVRDGVDPGGRFLNATLRGWAPGRA